MKLYEVNDGPPYLYATTATYTLPGSASVTLILAPLGSQFCVAFAAWRHVFKLHTAVDWDFRLWAIREKVWGKERIVMDELAAEIRGRGAGDPDAKKTYFVYILPDQAKGETVGELGLWTHGLARFGDTPNCAIVGGGPVDKIDEGPKNAELQHAKTAKRGFDVDHFSKDSRKRARRK